MPKLRDPSAPGPAPSLPRLAYGIAEAAYVSGLGATFVAGAIKDGSLASVRRGKRRLILHRDLMKWLEAGAA